MKIQNTKALLRSIGLLALCVVVAYFIGRSCSHVEQRLSGNDLEYLNGFLLGQKRLQDSTQQTNTRVVQITPQSLEKAKADLAAQIKADLERNYKRLATAKHVSTVTRVVERVPVHDTIVIIQLDTIPAKRFTYSDEWTKLIGLQFRDSVSIDYTTRADLRLYTYWKRGGLFKPRVLHAQLNTNNPHLSVERFTDISVPYKRKWHEKPAFRTVAALGLFGAGYFTATQLQ